MNLDDHNIDKENDLDYTKRYSSNKDLMRRNLDTSFDAYNNYNSKYNYLPTQRYIDNKNNYDNIDKEKISSSPPKDNFYRNLFIIFIIFALVFLVNIGYNVVRNLGLKSRTFMIYMVGSDLETNSYQGTYSIYDMVGKNIDLINNNVILITGGAKEWHNDLVSNDDIGIYSLTNNGFVKRKSLPLRSMGDYETLTDFLNYVYNNYQAKNYDLIFWNHGLGSLGIESDEISNDFLSISELNAAFANSNFRNKKLELTIFYNCLSSNLQIAKVMSKYSKYMVGSEELLYMAKELDRLSFLSDVRVADDGYDIGYKFITRSDSRIGNYNDNHVRKLKSTLSILDLSEIDELDKELNSFFGSINLDKYYRYVSRIRAGLYTYGREQVDDYDTVDLYNLITQLSEVTNQDTSKLLSSLDKVVVYQSNFDNHSNGLSTYFPYYGSNSAIENHFNTFSSLWNDNYVSFISNFHGIRTGRYRAPGDYYLTNNIINEDNRISLELTNEEMNNYQKANIYIFSKNDDKYNLLLKSDKVSLLDRNLVFDNNYLLLVNNEMITLEDTDDFKTYGTVSNDKVTSEVINYLSKVDNKWLISESLFKSKDLVSPSIVNQEDYNNISFYKESYDLYENGEFNEYFMNTLERENISFDKNNLYINIVDNELETYYVLIEYYDINNDKYYSRVQEIVK